MKKTFQIDPIQTPVFNQGDDLTKFICENVPSEQIAEKVIFAITSKIVSLNERRTLAKENVEKQCLIISEADYDLGEVAFGCRLTIKHGLFIPSSGIDESNSVDNEYILYPQDPFDSARRIYLALKENFKLQNFGVLITDSHTLPLRQGVTGIALSYWGFSGVRNMIGRKDLFGRELVMTKMDLADGLAAAAVLMMGEADEACPLAILKNAPVHFTDKTEPSEIQISPENDLYYPLYRERLQNSEK